MDEKAIYVIYLEYTRLHYGWESYKNIKKAITLHYAGIKIQNDCVLHNELDYETE